MPNLSLWSSKLFKIWRSVYMTFITLFVVPITYLARNEVGTEAVYFYLILGTLPLLTYLVLSRFYTQLARLIACVYDFLMTGFVLIMVVYAITDMNSLTIVAIAPFFGFAGETLLLLFLMARSRLAQHESMPADH